MKKLFGLMATACLAAAQLSAQGTITLNGTTYDTLEAAVSVVQADETIYISGTVETKARAGHSGNFSYSIVGSDNATILCKSRGITALMNNKGGNVTVSNITFDGENSVRDDNPVIACETGTISFNDVVFQNFIVDLKAENKGSASKECIITGKSAGNCVLNNVSFIDCQISEGFGMVYTTRDNGLTLQGNNVGLSVYTDKLPLKAEGLTNTTPIAVTFGTAPANGAVVVNGWNDASKFRFTNCAAGFGVEPDGSNLIYTSVNYVATMNGQGYKSLMDALNAANVATSDDMPTYTVELLEDDMITSRFIPAANTNITLNADTQRTVTRSNFNTGQVTLELSASNSVMTVNNIHFVNTYENVSQNLFNVQTGPLYLNNVSVDFANTLPQKIQVKKNGKMYVNNCDLQSVFVNTNGNLYLSGNNSFTLIVEAVNGNEYARIYVDSALTNEDPIVISDMNLASYVGMTLIQGELADASYFELPEGYEFTKVDGGLQLGIVTPTEAPELDIDEDEMTVTITVAPAYDIWYTVVDYTETESAARITTFDGARAASDEISEENGWTNSQQSTLTLQLENGKSYGFAAGTKEATPTFGVLTGISVSPSGKVTGIEAVEATEAEAAAEYFNLHGIRVENPTQGIYIRRQGSKTEKVVL